MSEKKTTVIKKRSAFDSFSVKEYGANALHQDPHIRSTGSNWVNNMSDEYAKENVQAITGKNTTNADTARGYIKDAPLKDLVNHIEKNGEPKWKEQVKGNLADQGHKDIHHGAKTALFEKREGRVKRALLNEPKSAAQRESLGKVRKGVKGASKVGRLVGMGTQMMVFFGLPAEWSGPAMFGMMAGEAIYMVGDLIFKGIEVALEAASLGAGTPIILVLEIIQAGGAIVAGLGGAIAGVIIYEGFVGMKHYIYTPYIRPYLNKTKLARKLG